MANNSQEFLVQVQDRLDKELSRLSGQTRSQVQQQVKAGRVQVDGQEAKAKQLVKPGQVIHILEEEIEEIPLIAQDMNLDILYEDQDLLVVNKPSGMVVHPSKGHVQDTLVNGLLGHGASLAQTDQSFRPGIVHRIDKDTSGLLVVAKNVEAHAKLSQMISSHQIERTYLAIVHGTFPSPKGVIDGPLARSSQNRLKRTVQAQGKPAVTHFQVLASHENYSLLKVRLETGRTHQIRAHMEYIGHPLVNDPLYGNRTGQATEFGQYLHAASLGFIHPTRGDFLHFEVKPPQEFVDFLTNWPREEVDPYV